MKFKFKYPVNKLLIKTWFAFLPVTIEGETRWLEKVSVKGYYHPTTLRFVKHKFI